MALLRNSSLFPRLTASTRRAIFYAACSAVLRGARVIEPQDLLIGVAELPHKSDCGFRDLYNARADVATQLGLPALPEDATDRFSTLQQLPRLSAASAAVLRAAASEADSGGQFWIDNDHLQVALALCDEKIDAILKVAGYSVENARQLGQEVRLKYPPRKPSWRQRARTRSTLFWVAVGTIAGFVLVNLVTLLRTK